MKVEAIKGVRYHVQPIGSLSVVLSYIFFQKSGELTKLL